MLFKKIIFDNYKTYYGLQEVILYIPEEVRKEERKNIILLGGLNGAGKTTILKAILYVLFGKRGISEVEHKRIFSNTINNTFFDEGGRDCSVTLILETDKKEEWELKVKWSFNHNKQLINENRSIIVRKPGVKHGRHAQIDNIDTYNRFIDRIIPYHAAPFFIFDGEEIREIILRQNSAEMKEAIHKITGMDAYKQLLDDFKMMKNNLEQNLAKAVSKTKLDKLQSDLDTIGSEIDTLEKRLKKTMSQRKSLEQKINGLKQERNQKILQNSKSREAIVKKQSRLATELSIAEKELEQYFKENAVQIILYHKILDLKQRIKEENDFKHKQILQEASLNPYRKFINQLLSQPISPPLTNDQLGQIKKLGEEIWLTESQGEQTLKDFTIKHDLSSNDYSYLANLPVKDRNMIVAQVNKIEKLKNQVEALEIEIRNAPEAVDLDKENKDIDELTKEFGEIDLRYKTTSKKLARAKENRTSILNQITRLSDQGANFEELSTRLNMVNQIISAINQYVTEATEMKARFIRDEFASMLSKLFRKQDEFGAIEFDIVSYTIRLYNDRNQEISIQDRSAGEMQMISSALIWALTKASDLGLPMVIDTPLGRLDSYHRSRLITHYYRELSEQVIILSTDTEITQEYVDLMRDNSYKQYMLDYDQEKKYTIIRDGYFNFVKV